MLERVRNALFARNAPPRQLELPPDENRAQYEGRFVVVELGPNIRGLLNSLSIPEERKPLYIGMDYLKDDLGQKPKDGAPSAAAMQVNFVRPEFTDRNTLDGCVDRFVAFNVFAVLTENKKLLDKAFFKVSRMLKPGGKAIIGEWYTPDWADALQGRDYAKYGLEQKFLTDEVEIRALFDEFGVSEERQKVILQRLAAERGGGSGYGKPFLLVLTKPEADAQKEPPQVS